VLLQLLQGDPLQLELGVHHHHQQQQLLALLLLLEVHQMAMLQGRRGPEGLPPLHLPALQRGLVLHHLQLLLLLLLLQGQGWAHRPDQ